MNPQNKALAVGVILSVASIALPLAIAASVQHGHRVELVKLEDELRAECIAVILGESPRKTWLDVAIEYKSDPYVCKHAMEKYPNDIATRGEDWQHRLDISRSVIDP